MTPPSDDDFEKDPALLAGQDADSSEDEGGEGEGKGKGKAGRGSGTGSAGISRGDISPAFFQLMTKFGASMDQITQIMREWTHLRGENLVRYIAGFARDIARASAQPQVAFDGDFGIVTHFLMSLRGKGAVAPVSKPQGLDDTRPGPR